MAIVFENNPDGFFTKGDGVTITAGNLNLEAVVFDSGEDALELQGPNNPVSMGLESLGWKVVTADDVVSFELVFLVAEMSKDDASSLPPFPCDVEISNKRNEGTPFTLIAKTIRDDTARILAKCLEPTASGAMLLKG